MFKIESYIGPLLMGYLNKYVKLNEESFKLSLWGGDAVFHNVELQCDILEHLMLLPIGFKSGQVHELKIHIPWTKLGSESVIITLNTVECILELKSDFIRKTKSDMPKSESNTEKLDKQKNEKNVPPGYIKSYLFNIINNIHVKVNNLIIKFVEDDIVLSMNAKTLEYYPVNEQWSKGFINLSSGNLNVQKVIEVFDLTICLDQMDANGQIEVYQEPILYRCSVECRFFTNYKSINSNVTNFIKFNIKFGEIDMNISTSQMPMMRRLIELVYALYYGTINWDSVVGCGFSKQLIGTNNVNVRDDDTKVEVDTNLDATDGGDSDKSWASWAWSYVPSIFAEEDNLGEEDQINSTLSGTKFKKTVIFGISFQAIHWKIKKSHITKSIFGSRRSNCNKTLSHFFTIVTNNISINTINNGLGFFNVQLGCTEIKLFNVGKICICGQEFSSKNDKNENTKSKQFITVGGDHLNQEHLSDFYLTANMFSDKEPIGINIIEDDINRLNNITSQESYASLYSEENCLKHFSAMWFDYIYFMQIVKDNLDESQIDLMNLCNTDGIRESSLCNLYVGKTIVEINSYSVHNMKEITKSLDTSKYLSYFRPYNVDDRQNIFYPTEEQVARIHEFVPVRQHKISFVKLSIKIHGFTESHQIPDDFPILELKTRCITFSKLCPMYPKHLIGCVSILNPTLLKESTELINKCYILKSLKIKGFSISFLLSSLVSDNLDTNDFIRTRILEQCDISYNDKLLLFPDTWKTSSFVINDKALRVSKIKLALIPSHLKAGTVIIASNYPWICGYLGSSLPKSGVSSMYKRLDELTLQLLGSQSFLIESCHKLFYQNRTFELHICLPEFVLQSRKTSISSFIDVKVFHNSLLVYLRNPESTFIIPVLDNKCDGDLPPNGYKCDLFILSCQIPNQIKPINCAFNLQCQMGSVNFMFSQQLISWLIYPLLDLDLEQYIDSDIFPTFSTFPKNSSTNRSSVTITDIRSIADGSSRPESPNLFYNKQPVPGHPKPINFTVEKGDNQDLNRIKFLSNKSGWWNIVKDACSKYFFLLQSLDVCIKMTKSNFYITTLTNTSSFQSQCSTCTEWVENYLRNKHDESIFVVQITRLALINSQRREYLNDSFQAGHLDSLHFQSKPTTIIDSLPWELIFHDIGIDCLHSLSAASSSSNYSKLLHDSILKPVSINCTLSATPKCSSPDKLDTLYSVSWGVHIDITEVQPTIKQIYLAKLLKLFGDIIFGLPWTDFMKNLKYLLTGHYRIVEENCTVKCFQKEKPIPTSRHSASTKSTKKSKSSIEHIEDPIGERSKGVILNSKFETQSVNEMEHKFKMSFWIQCTLSQFQLIIMNDNVEMDHQTPYVYLMLQIDDATSCIDVQEKFVEIKGKLGSILCQIGLMKDEKIVSEIPILKTGSKFINNMNMPFSYKTSDDSHHVIDDMSSESIIRHCLSIAVIRTTPNNLSKRPISTYHQFKENESFKSYPSEFTGNFSTAINLNNKYQSYVTQISSIVEPFDLYLPPFFLRQCIEISNTFVSLCNQLLQASVQKWTARNKASSPISASSIKNEPYFISEDMPQFHLLVKSSRIILPRFQDSKCTIYDHLATENGCIIVIWKKISLQPFSNNPISRPQIIEDSIDENCSSIDSHTKTVNCLDDNRQFQFDIFQCGIFLIQNSNSVTSFPNQSSFDGIQRVFSHSSDVMNPVIIHGQNPAFEWNNLSQLSSFMQSTNNLDTEWLPIMKPIDIQVIFAGAIHESLNSGLKRHLIGGYGLEINIQTNLEFFFDHCILDMINCIVTNVNEILIESDENINRISPEDHTTLNIDSLETFCRLKNIDGFIPSVPINFLMTMRKIQILLLLPQNIDTSSLSPVHGVCVSISQPHAMLSFKSRHNHKFEIAFFDFNLSVTPRHWSEKINFHDLNQSNFWLNRESFILAEMKTVIKTKPGHPDVKTGVPASLLTVVFSNFYQSTMSHCKMSFTRQVLVNIEIEDVAQLHGVMNLLSRSLQPIEKTHSIRHDKSSSSSFPWFIFLPINITVSSEQFSINVMDTQNNGDDQFELKVGPLSSSLNLVRNFEWNNLYFTIFVKCSSVVIIHSAVENGLISDSRISKFVLYPTKIISNSILSNYRFNSLDNHWKSFEWRTYLNFGTINLSVTDNQLMVFHKMLTKISDILSAPSDTITRMVEMNQNEKSDCRVEIFYDELRTNKFQLITNVSSKDNEFVSFCGSSLIADEGTISFSDDNDDVASMLWTYSEPRCIVAIEVKPVPFVFIECNFAKDEVYEKLQIPCKLEYWNPSTYQYELYQTFNLSENETEKVENLPTVEQLSQSNETIIVAKSWRVVFDCYARYVNSDKTAKQDLEKAMLVYLSPLVLAASLRIDSCYAPFLVKHSLLKLSMPQIDLTLHESEMQDVPLDVSKPYKSVNKTFADYSISDHNILLKCFLRNVSMKKLNKDIKSIKISRSELFLSDPFVALQLPIVILDDLCVILNQNKLVKEQLTVEIGDFQMGFDSISMKQMFLTVGKMNNIIAGLVDYKAEKKEISLDIPKFLFCNNLDRRIRIKQKEDNFQKMSDTARVGGLGSGESIILRFLPIKQNKIPCNDLNMNFTVNDQIEVVLGLCSELKGSIKWTEPVELPLPIFNKNCGSYSDFGIWKLDTNIKTDVSLMNSTLSNSYNAKNLFYIHSQCLDKVNKIILLGNTIINNATSHSVHVNFSLPTQLSSGISFSVPPQLNSMPTSQYINWKFVSNSSKHVLELSFRVINSSPENTEYRSLPYQIDVPKLSETQKTNHQQQIIIKLQFFKADGHMISSRNLHFQFLCTLEWFKFVDAEEMFLLITLSPLVIVENQMIRDVELHISNSVSDEKETVSTTDEAIIVHGKGDTLKLFSLFTDDNVKLNASFINNVTMLFNNSLVLTECGVLESLLKKLNLIYENKFNKLNEKEKLEYIASLLTQIIDNNEKMFKNHYIHNPYSVIVTISPWILISNKTQLNLVLSFDESLYYLESNSDFVPSQSDKPMKIGVTFENDIYWSKQFAVGKNAINETDNSLSDIMWSFMRNEIKDEAFLQLNVLVGKSKSLVPLTLKHLFVDNINNSETSSNKFYHLIIESSIFIRNETDLNLDVEALYLINDILQPSSDISKNILQLRPDSGYHSINKFDSVSFPNKIENANKLALKINLSGDENPVSHIFNCLPLVNFDVFATKGDSNIETDTNFLYVKDLKDGSDNVDFKAFLVNTTISLLNQKVYLDIFHCKFVPIKFTNWSTETIMIDETGFDRKWNKSSVIQVEPMQSVPYWPIDFQIDINKDGCGNFTKSSNRFRVGIENEQGIDWTETFPLSCSDLPSNIALYTVNGKQSLQLVLESDNTASLVVHFYQESSERNNSTADICHFSRQRLSISRLSFSLLERQRDLETFVESIRASFENVTCSLSSYSSNHNVVYEISTDHIQIDNKLFSSGLYDFPVFLNSLKTEQNKQFFSAKIETNGVSSYSLNITFHNEMELFIENAFLYDFLRFFSQFFNSLVPTTKDPMAMSVLSRPPFNIKEISVSPILLRMTIHAFMKLYVSCEATSLGLPEFFLSDCSIRLAALQKRLWNHYITAALVRCGCVLGSIELLGNPTGIVRHLTAGLTDLLSSRNIDHNVLMDFLLRVLSFCRHTSGGFISSFTGIAASVSRNLDYFTLDNTHVTRQELLRRKSFSNGLMNGFITGLSGFALSLLGAIAGIADQPLQASQQALNSNSSVSVAVIKGFGRGLIGAVTKPLSGTAEFFAQTGRGLLNTTGITVYRSHSNLVQFTLTSKSDLLFDVDQFLYYSLHDSVPSSFRENTPILFWSSIAVNEDQVFVYLFLTKDYILEWFLNHPLKNKKCLYFLTNYNISVSSHSVFKYRLTLKRENKENNSVFSRQAMNPDSRINAFISELQYPKESDIAIRNHSQASSTDSTEYVKFNSPSPDFPKSDADTEENHSVVNIEEINFYSNQSLEGILDALTFLNSQNDCFGGLIM